MAQTKKVDLRKGVYSKAQYEQVIDTNFSQLGVPSISASAEDSISVEQFFGFYNSLFYDIPQTGEVNSHEFLVKTSGEYIDFDNIAEEIIALQEEIAGLRRELLQEQIKNVELTTGEVVNTSSLDLGVETDSVDTSIAGTNILSGGVASSGGSSTSNTSY